MLKASRSVYLEKRGNLSEVWFDLGGWCTVAECAEQEKGRRIAGMMVWQSDWTNEPLWVQELSEGVNKWVSKSEEPGGEGTVRGAEVLDCVNRWSGGYF